MASAWGTSWGVAWGSSWDTSATPAPARVPGFAVELGDGYIRYGNVIRWLPRPKELEPAKAEALAVKKVAKRLGITKHEAQNVVSLVQREVSTQVNYLRAAGMATSGRPDDKYTTDQIREMRDYWAAVVACAIDEDEDDVMLLLQ